MWWGWQQCPPPVPAAPTAPGLTSVEGHPAVPGLRARDGFVIVEGALHGTERHRATGAALRERQDGAHGARSTEPTGPGAWSPRGRAVLCRAVPRRAHLELAEPVLPRVSRARLLRGGSAVTASVFHPGKITLSSPASPWGCSMGPRCRAVAWLGAQLGAGTTWSHLGTAGASTHPNSPSLPPYNEAETRPGPRVGTGAAGAQVESGTLMAPGCVGTPRGLSLIHI